MPSFTTYKPTSITQFEAAKLNFNAQGVSGSASAGSSTSFDLALTDDHLITGAWIITDGGTLGDTASFQIVDGTGAFSGVPGTVLNQFVSSWYMPTGANTQLDMQYPAKLYAGMVLRFVYTSTGGSPVFVAINYKLHKVLI
tara:strand:- start:3111 stop:3533 length:423 start_codon:yes stop_codon:yes gene_type:complete